GHLCKRAGGAYYPRALPVPHLHWMSALHSRMRVRAARPIRIMQVGRGTGGANVVMGWQKEEKDQEVAITAVTIRQLK
ncbi:unnamed protein product, partial [Amoebophrya sp. A25]